MEIQFDKNKNLENDLILTVTEFKHLFGFNKERQKKIDNLFKVAKEFKDIGCETMFIFGSFTTAIEQPNDIDVCFDLSNLDVKILEKKHTLLDNYERKRFKEYFGIHLPFFKIQAEDEDLMQFMKTDKSGNKRGTIKLNLKKLQGYDKE